MFQVNEDIFLHQVNEDISCHQILLACSHVKYTM